MERRSQKTTILADQRSSDCHRRARNTSKHLTGSIRGRFPFPAAGPAATNDEGFPIGNKDVRVLPGAMVAACAVAAAAATAAAAADDAFQDGYVLAGAIVLRAQMWNECGTHGFGPGSRGK